jgi:hypothetical protein
VTEENMTRITEKNHGTLLTIWLFLMLIGNFFSSISYLTSNSTFTSLYPNTFPGILWSCSNHFNVKNICYKIGNWHSVIWFNWNIDSIFVTKTKMGFVRIIPQQKDKRN